MTPSAIVSSLIFTGCLMAGVASGEWVVGAVVGVLCVVAFILILSWGTK